MSTKRPTRKTSEVISRLLLKPQQAMEESERKKRERRYAAIDSAVRERPKMTLSKDCEVVASNLGKILGRFEDEGKGRKETVLRNANMGESGNSTKQLYNYTLPRSTETSDTLQRRKEKLIKKVEGYRKLAEIAAELSGWNKKDVLIELFSGTSYDTGVSGGDVNTPDYIFSIEELLCDLNIWLVRETDIEWYYKTLRKFPIWDELGNFEADRPHWPVHDNSDRSPAYFGKAILGVMLYRVLGAELPVEFVAEHIDDRLDLGDEPPPGRAVEHLIFRRYFDIRLGLAPVDMSGNIRFVFDQRRIDELWKICVPDGPDDAEANEEWYAYTPSFFKPNVVPDTEWSNRDLFRFPPPVTTTIESSSDWLDELGGFTGWLRFPKLDRQSRPPSEIFENETNLAIDNDEAVLRAIQDQFIEEADPSACKKYLDIDAARTKCELPWLSTALESPGNTIAARIESGLYTDEAESRLDTLLREEIEHRCAVLRRCLERRNSLIADNRSKLRSSWGIPGKKDNTQ